MSTTQASAEDRHDRRRERRLRQAPPDRPALLAGAAGQRDRPDGHPSGAARPDPRPRHAPGAAGGAPGARITRTTDRRAALDGADYVICSIQVGGLEMYEPDVEIPRRYGIDQTVGDTLGPGGVFRGLRTVPVLVSIARDMEALCPHALLVNYSNPMNINMWGVSAPTQDSQHRALPLGAGHGRPAGPLPGRPARRALLLVRRDQPPGLVPGPAPGARRGAGGGPLPPAAPEAGRPGDVRPGPGALRGDAPLRLLRHREHPPHERVRPLVPHLKRSRSSASPPPAGTTSTSARTARTRTTRRWSARPGGEEPIETERTHEYCSYIVNSMETNTPYVMNANVPNTLGPLRRRSAAGPAPC